MECTNCQIHNESDAKFCKNCGTSLEYYQKNSKEKTSGILIVVFLSYILLSFLINTFLLRRAAAVNINVLQLVSAGLSIFMGIWYFILAFAVSHSYLRIVAFIISAVLFILILSINIVNIVRISTLPLF